MSTCIPNHLGGRNWGRRGEFCLNLSLNPKHVYLAVLKLLHNKTYTDDLVNYCQYCFVVEFLFFFSKTLNLQKRWDSYLGTWVKRFWQPLQPVSFLALTPQALHSGTFTDTSCPVSSLCFGSFSCWKVHNSRRTWALSTRFLLSSPSIPPLPEQPSCTRCCHHVSAETCFLLWIITKMSQRCQLWDLLWTGVCLSNSELNLQMWLFPPGLVTHCLAEYSSALSSWGF